MPATGTTSTDTPGATPKYVKSSRLGDMAQNAVGEGGDCARGGTHQEQLRQHRSALDAKKVRQTTNLYKDIQEMTIGVILDMCTHSKIFI